MDYHYLVTALCGHVGRNWGIVKCFPIKADSGKEAARKCRCMPRVKHDNKHAILETRLVSEEEYSEQLETNNADPYFKASTRREGFLLGVDESNRIDMTVYREKKWEDRESFNRNTFHGISRKRYVNHYMPPMEEYNAAI